MKRRISIKSICMMLVALMLAAFVPMGVMASENEQTITAEFDTYIDLKNTAVSNTKTTLLYQENGNSGRREMWVRYNLSEINVPEGMEIDTAKIILNFNTYYNVLNNDSTVEFAQGSVSAYALSSQEYDDNVQYNTSGKPTKSTKLATTVIAPDGAFTKGNNPVEFDISEYIKSKEGVFDKETFAFSADYKKMNGSVHSLEASDAAKRPKLVVTYKYSEQTLTALDTAVARQDGETDNTSLTYPTQNIGNSKYNRAAYYKFDLGKVTIPEGAVVTEAALRLYVTYNYNKTPTDIKLYNIADDSWTSSSIVTADTSTSWEAAPDSDVILSGVGTSQGVSGVATVPYVDTTAITEWIEFDVTEYVTNQYYTDKDKLVSFAAFPETRRVSGAVNIASNSYQGYEPRLVIRLGNEEEVAIGTPTFSEGELSNVVEALPKSGLSYIKIPVTGATKTPKKSVIYVVQYEADTDALVGVNVFNDLDFYSGNGEISFGFYPKKLDKQCYVEAYVWSPDGISYADAHIDMTAP